MYTPYFPPFRPPHYVSIDGGTKTVGLCYFTYDNGRMVVLENRLLDLSKLPYHYEYLVVRYGELTARIKALREQLADWLDGLPELPQQVYYESHFFNPRRPTSAIPLVKFMANVEDILISRGITIDFIAPQQMKKAVNITGKLSKADKDKVYQAIRRLVVEGKILYHHDCPIDMLSEHEIDSIGIGYTGILPHLG